MVSIDDVKAAYRFILGRDPENEEVVVSAAARFESISELRLAFLGSAEFHANLRRNFQINPPPPTDLQAAASASISRESADHKIFIQTCDPHDYFGMLAASSQTVRQYCTKYGHGYEVYIGIKQGCFPWHACFNRIFVLKELWERGFRGWVIYLDADSIVVDQDFDLTGYLDNKTDFAAVLTYCGWGPWWNINNGVMILNYSHPWVEWFIGRYYAMFTEYCLPNLRQATTWGSIPHDQDLLQQILGRSELNRQYIFFEDLNLLNFTESSSDSLPSAPFIQQVLGVHGSVPERTAIIAARVAEIVGRPPAMWHADLLTLLSQEHVDSGRRWTAGREPGNRDFVETSRSMPQVSETFANPARCPEPLRAPSPSRPLSWPPILVETDATPTQLAAMAARIEATWLRLGDADPHWSVITSERFRSSNIGDTEAEFYQTGRADMENLCRTAERCGINLDEFADCFELGCGIGRVTCWLAERFRRVTAADISRAHLDLCRTALQRFGRANVRFVQLNSFAAFQDVPKFDLFISTIVLQHNPPPLIALLLKTILRRLQPGGIAYFQVPTYKERYRFVTEEYLADATPDRGMEMHLIPQHVLFEILRQSGCRVLECREDDAPGDFSMISNTILVQKEAARPGRAQRGLRLNFLRGLQLGSPRPRRGE